ncbi:MAG: filamentous hemagglutinin N-terminal domain-containing protein [Synechococcales cyanobacterium CRU_2_2]|nr:filamentous hemagglutinin N-terminal domain-containing protein [Synechococcales cyanobacterium CRU_2_2]
MRSSSEPFSEISSGRSCGRAPGRTSAAIALLPWFAVASFQGTGWASVVVPQISDTGTSVTTDGTLFRISGTTVSGDGGNLFHTFEQFNLTADQTAIFLTNPAIQNVLGRIVGGEASRIDGTLRLEGSNANLLLLNPSGLLFGPNVQLDLPGSFTATTAAGVGFAGSGAWLSAIANTGGNPGANAYADFSGAPNAFWFSPAIAQAPRERSRFSAPSISPTAVRPLVNHLPKTWPLKI